MWSGLHKFQQFLEKHIDISAHRSRRFIFLVVQALTEVCLVFTVLKIYSLIRNSFGSAAVTPEFAFSNAQKVISLERFFGLFFEQELQLLVLKSSETMIIFCNNYYSAMHFVSVVGTLCILFLFRLLVCVFCLVLLGFLLLRFCFLGFFVVFV